MLPTLDPHSDDVRTAGAERATAAFGRVAAEQVGVASLLLTGVVLIEEWRALASASPGDAIVVGAGTALAVAIALPLLALLALVAAAAPRVGVRWTAAAIAAASAMATALGAHASLRAGRLGEQAVSLALAAGAVAGLAALLVVAVVRRLRARAPWSIAPAAIGVAAVAGEINRLWHPRLYPAAHLVLSASIVVCAAVAADAAMRARTFRRAVRALGLAGLVLGLLLVGLAPRSAQAVSSSTAMRALLHENSELLRPIVGVAATLAPPPREELDVARDPLEAAVVGPSFDARGRDLLLITVDALRADHVGAYGYSRNTTPVIDRLSESGVRFARAYTAAPQTSYALSSIMTGKHVRAGLDLESSGVGRPPDRTWADAVAAAGYRTAAFYPETIFFTDRRRFTELATRKLGFEEATVVYHTAEERVAHAASFVRGLPSDARFFAWVHLFEPHEPYEARAEFPFGDAEIDRYDAEIALVDRAIGALVEQVRALRPGTIVIVTADHGEAFGEHGSRYHGTTLYEEQVRVPLVISAPGVLPARVIEGPVGTVDLFPTFARAMATSPGAPLRGRDLGPALLDGDDRGFAFASLPGVTLLAIGTERLICTRATAACALFDLRADPAQVHPIFEMARVSPLTSQLQATVDGHRFHELGAPAGRASADCKPAPCGALPQPKPKR